MVDTSDRIDLRTELIGLAARCADDAGEDRIRAACGDRFYLRKALTHPVYARSADRDGLANVLPRCTVRGR